MSGIILHHYPTSPFSEKVRAILGYKQMNWQSVHIPPVMPKPDLIALTGGYRKTPVMQIGSDVYCDSKLIVRVLEHLQPQPPLIPKGLEATMLAEDAWSEQHLFFLTVPIVMQPQGMPHFFSKLPPAAIEHFQKDRAALFGAGSGRRPSMAATRAELPVVLSCLDTQLDAAHFLHGETPTLADFSVYHTIWFILGNPGIADYLAPYKNIHTWAHRIAAFGHGQFELLSPEQALQIAQSSTPRAFEGDNVSDASSPHPGDAVTVNATDYGTDAVKGTLAHLSVDEIVLRRRDERAGEIHVHFPRDGFRLSALKH
jgi:glutathione S-transferase